MSCEGGAREHGVSPVAVVIAVERPVTTTAIVEGPKMPHPYFDPKIDWQAGAVNPNRAAVEARSRSIMERPTLISFSD